MYVCDTYVQSCHKLFLSQAVVLLHLAASKQAFGKSKLMSRPVTSWQERMERRNQRQTSNTSQKVLCVTSVMHIIYEHIITNISHQWVYHLIIVVCMPPSMREVIDSIP
jgi:hypothetical protein